MRSDEAGPGEISSTQAPTGSGAAFGSRLAVEIDGYRVLLTAAALTLLTSLLALSGGPYALFFDDVQELSAAFGGAVALALASRRALGSTRWVGRAFAVALAGAGIGMTAWDLSDPLGRWLRAAGDVTFVVSVGVGIVAAMRAIFGGIRSDRLVGIAIDTLIVFLAGTAVVAALWRADVIAPGDQTASLGAVTLIAASAACAFGLIARRTGPSAPGSWVALAGATTLGAAWLLWIAKPSAPSSIDPSDFMFSAAMLLIAYGGIAWSDRPSEGRWMERIASLSGSLLPVGAILGSIVLLVAVNGSSFADLLGLSTSALIATAAVRQLYLYTLEARSRATVEARTEELQDAVTALEREITERRRLEKEREAMQARILQSQRLESVGRLAGGVAHDFNNLLTAIQGYAELIAIDLPPDSASQADLEAIRHASDQAASLTRQLLAFSRNQALRPSVVDLGDVVIAAEPLLRRLLGERITFDVRLAADLRPVLVDPGQFEAIIVNLAVNARDAMDDGGRLTIETANVDLDDAYAEAHADVIPGRYASLAVSDTGAGMDRETLGHIFEPFFTTKAQGKGIGLGLSSVYGTVRQSGGHIAVSSEPGHGTAFVIYLPATEVAGAPAAATRAATVAPRTHRETVLVAEDEDAVRRMIVAALERQGYSVIAVENGEEALVALRLRDVQIDALLTDVVMPGIGGLELIAAAREVCTDLPAVCMSGYAPATLVARDQSIDVQFLPKPFTVASLHEVMSRVLGETAAGRNGHG